MFDTKLANSIQQDYRQSADNHRLAQAVGSKVNRAGRIQSVALFGTIFATLFIIF